jgi:hypothetical protein
MATANDSNRPSARARSYESKISDGKVTVYNYGREIGYCGALADLVAAGICTEEAYQTFNAKRAAQPRGSCHVAYRHGGNLHFRTSSDGTVGAWVDFTGKKGRARDALHSLYDLRHLCPTSQQDSIARHQACVDRSMRDVRANKALRKFLADCMNAAPQ